MPPDEEGSSLIWGRHEAEILDLFVTRNKTLKEVKKHMEKEHGLIATYGPTLHAWVFHNADDSQQRETIQIRGAASVAGRILWNARDTAKPESHWAW